MSEKFRPEIGIPNLAGKTIGDFWAWAYSDILSNSNRGVFAEFLVGSALDAVTAPRIEWDSYDLRYGDKKIEVKASGYIQSWNQSKPSTISFDIAPKNSLDGVTNTFANVVKRSADCYVFCLYTEQDKSRANVLDIAMWVFYVLATTRLDAVFGSQKQVGLKVLQKYCEPIKYEQLRLAVDRALFGSDLA